MCTARGRGPLALALSGRAGRTGGHDTPSPVHRRLGRPVRSARLAAWFLRPLQADAWKRLRWDMTGDGAQGQGLCSPPEGGAPPVNPCPALFIYSRLPTFLQNGLISWESVLVPRPVQACAGMAVPRGLQPAFFLPQFLPLFLPRLSSWPGWPSPVLGSGWNNCRSSVLRAGRPLLAQPLMLTDGHFTPQLLGLLGQPPPVEGWGGGEVGGRSTGDRYGMCGGG